MKIRKARLNDVTEIVELWKDLMDHHRDFNSRKVQTIKKNGKEIFRSYARICIRSRNALVLVAEEKGKLVGYSLNNIKKNIPVYLPEKYGYFSDLFVKKEFRGRGISTEFIKAAISWFKKKGIRQARIMADTDNRRTLKIYRHWGMIPGHLELMKKI